MTLVKKTKAKYGKGIQRSEYQHYINRNKQGIEQNPDYYRQRQAIVEHPYGTIKRQWGFNYITTKKHKHRASADVGLMFVAYNFRRLINIIGKNELEKYLAKAAFIFSGQIAKLWLDIMPYGFVKFVNKNRELIFNHPLKRLKFELLLIKLKGF